MGGRPRYAVILGLAFATVMLSFVASTVVSQGYAWEIRALSDSLAHNAMPSIEHLTTARAELRFMRSRAAELRGADDAGRGVIDHELQAAQAKVDDEVNAYLRLARYPGEDALWKSIQGAKSDVDARVATVRAKLDVRAPSTSDVAAFEAACDRAAEAFLDDIEFNAKNGHDIAERIGEIRSRSFALGVALDGVSVIATAIAAVFAIRAVSRYGALLQRHNDLLVERADELEQFAGRVAHDIAGPISTGKASLALARRRGDPAVEAIAARGLSSLQRAQRLLEGLLAFARAGAKPAPDARAQVDEVVAALVDDLRPLAVDAGVDLRCDPLPRRAVRCDASILEVLVANLVRNAIKYIGDGPERRVTVSAKEAGSALRIAVEDTGPGVARELVGPIFEPFVRGPSRGQEGAGLGLATVRRICERHGGRAGLDSTVGHGSTFWIELPVDE